MLFLVRLDAVSGVSEGRNRDVRILRPSSHTNTHAHTQTQYVSSNTHLFHLRAAAFFLPFSGTVVRSAVVL